MSFSLNVKTDHSLPSSIITDPPSNFKGAVVNTTMGYWDKEREGDIALGYSFKFKGYQISVFSLSGNVQPVIQFKNNTLSPDGYPNLCFVLPEEINKDVAEKLKNKYPSSKRVVGSHSGKPSDTEINFKDVRFIEEEDRETYQIYSGEKDGHSLELSPTANKNDHAFHKKVLGGYNYVLPSVPEPNSWRGKCFRSFLLEKVSTFSDVYKDRLEEELQLIEERGFENTFKVVSDYVSYAVISGILVGAGRGSVSNSLVAFLLGITDVDPITYNLPFERFLNPERSVMPDIDIDFEARRIKELHDYLKGMYGKNNVSLIRTYNTLQSRSAIRYVGKAMNLQERDINFVSHQMKGAATLKDVLNKNFVRRRLHGHGELFKKHALTLEGVKRSESIHPSGVIVNDEDLRNLIPLSENKDGTKISELQDHQLTELGFLKFDLLSLRTLDFLKDLESLTGVVSSDVELEDDLTFDLFSKGETDGVFQFESDGMKDTLKLVKPRSITELAIVSSLFRPGPREFIQHFSFNKERGFNYHYKIDSILQETHGIIVFQEQFNEIISIFDGCSIGMADNIRRGISEDDEEDVKKTFRNWYESSFQTLPDLKNRNFLFSMLFKMRAYSFPKGHAISYSIFSYRLAFYKCHHPEYFSKLLLKLKPDLKDSIIEFLKNKGWSIIPPSFNRSEEDIIDEEEREYHLSPLHLSVRNKVGFKEVMESENKVEWGIERTIMEYCLMLHKKDVEVLVFGGFFDTDKISNRRALIETVEHYYNLIEGRSFSGEEYEYFGIMGVPKYETDYSEDVLLSKEFESLGCHTKTKLIDFLSSTVKHTKISDVILNESAVLFGEIISLRIIKTSKGDDMVFLEIEDGTGTIDVVVFPNVLERFRNEMARGYFVRVSGVVGVRNEKTQIIANEIKKA